MPSGTMPAHSASADCGEVHCVHGRWSSCVHVRCVHVYMCTCQMACTQDCRTCIQQLLSHMFIQLFTLRP
jgi:hypothetical protein